IIFHREWSPTHDCTRIALRIVTADQRYLTEVLRFGTELIDVPLDKWSDHERWRKHTERYHKVQVGQFIVAASLTVPRSRPLIQRTKDRDILSLASFDCQRCMSDGPTRPRPTSTPHHRRKSQVW